jgi:hypothetical protein
VVLFLKLILDQSPSGHPNAFEKRSDEDLRTQTMFTSLRVVAAEA